MSLPNYNNMSGNAYQQQLLGIVDPYKTSGDTRWGINYYNTPTSDSYFSNLFNNFSLNNFTDIAKGLSSLGSFASGLYGMYNSRKMAKLAQKQYDNTVNWYNRQYQETAKAKNSQIDNAAGAVRGLVGASWTDADTNAINTAKQKYYMDTTAPLR